MAVIIDGESKENLHAGSDEARIGVGAEGDAVSVMCVCTCLFSLWPRLHPCSSLALPSTTSTRRGWQSLGLTMPALSRLLYLPASRRTFSSYFSSKSGGGRYFNSAKSPKSAVVGSKANVKNDTSSEVQKDGTQSASAPSVSSVVNTGTIGDAQASSTTNSSASSSVSGVSENSGSVTSQSSSLADAFAEFNQHHIPQISISSKDFKTHQFFSLHRPLLLINQPSSIFRSIPHNQPLFGPLQQEADKLKQQFGLETSTDPFIDADAEAARQLTRALTMSKAASTLAWENTMKHLGLDVSKDADRVNLQQQFDKEWEEVMLDSTKRKRRKKMKKHKWVPLFALTLFRFGVSFENILTTFSSSRTG